MAKTSNIQYCTTPQLLEIYPQLSEFDLKKRITNWSTTSTTNLYEVYDTGFVDGMFFDGVEGTAVTDEPNSNAEFKYFEDDDKLQVFHTTSPNDMIMESGKDWSNLQTTFLRRASRMVESMLDSRLSRQIKKDREGNYPEFIIRAVGLKAAYLLINANDPDNEMAESFKEEFLEIIDGYRSGMISLPESITKDSANGVIREVQIDPTSDLRMVELMGSYNAFGYDLIKVLVTKGGKIGASTYSVWIKDQDKLKSYKCLTDEKITGDYDIVVSGLYMRFAGDDDNATTSDDDEYEIEVHGSSMKSSNSQSGTISMTRR